MFSFENYFVKTWSKAHQINRRTCFWIEQAVNQVLTTAALLLKKKKN